MFKENKTYEWLSSKSDAGKYMVVKNAIKSKVDIEIEETKRKCRNLEKGRRKEKERSKAEAVERTVDKIYYTESELVY